MILRDSHSKSRMSSWSYQHYIFYVSRMSGPSPVFLTLWLDGFLSVGGKYAACSFIRICHLSWKIQTEILEILLNSIRIVQKSFWIASRVSRQSFLDLFRKASGHDTENPSRNT